MITKLIIFLSIWMPSGALMAHLSIRVWTKKKNNYYIAAMLYPFTVRARHNWDTRDEMMEREFGKFACTIRPAVYDLLIGDGSKGAWGKVYYYTLHMLFWGVRVVFNIFSFIASFFVKPLVPALEHKPMIQPAE